MSRILLLLLAILGLPPTTFAAGDAPLDRATLRGLTSINVVVDKLEPDLESAGVTPDSVRTRLEDRLRGANIPIDEKKSEFLAVRMHSVRANRGPFALAITLGAYQPVILSRDNKIRTATQTWEVETIVLSDARQLYRAAMDSVDELVAGFIAAYRAVNSTPEAKQ